VSKTECWRCGATYEPSPYVYLSIWEQRHTCATLYRRKFTEDQGDKRQFDSPELALEAWEKLERGMWGQRHSEERAQAVFVYQWPNGKWPVCTVGRP
jgi:hypothetical protein